MRQSCGGRAGRECWAGSEGPSISPGHTAPCILTGYTLVTVSVSSPRLDGTTESSFLSLTVLSTYKKSRRLEGSCFLGLSGWHQIKPQKQGNITDSEQLLTRLSPYTGASHTYCSSGFGITEAWNSQEWSSRGSKTKTVSGKGGSQRLSRLHSISFISIETHSSREHLGCTSLTLLALEQLVQGKAIRTLGEVGKWGAIPGCLADCPPDTSVFCYHPGVLMDF